MSPLEPVAQTEHEPLPFEVVAGAHLRLGAAEELPRQLEPTAEPEPLGLTSLALAGALHIVEDARTRRQGQPVAAAQSAFRPARCPSCRR